MQYLPKLYQNVALSLLFLVAFAPVLDNVTGIKFAGFSFFVTVLPSFLLFSIYLFNFKLFKPIHSFLLGVTFLFFITSIFLRKMVYGEFSLKAIGSVLFIFFIPIAFLVFQYVQFEDGVLKKLSYLLRIILIFNFIISFLYMLGLPTLIYTDVNSPDYVEFGRYVGIMGGSNVQGIFVFTVFMILLLGPFEIGIWQKILFFILTFLAVLPTVSRNSILGVSFIFLFSLYNYYKVANFLSRAGLLATLTVFILLLVNYVDFSYVSVFLESFSARFDSDDLSGSRIEKVSFALTTLFSNFEYLLIGIPANRQENSEISISDNSLILIIVSFGLPFFLYFIYLIRHFQLNKFKPKKRLMVYVFIIFVIIITNNAFLWFSWLLFAIMGYCLLRGTTKKESNYKVQSA